MPFQSIILRTIWAALLVMIPLVMTGARPDLPPHLAAPMRIAAIQITLNGSTQSGSDLGIEVSGMGAPTGFPPICPFTYAIKLNGWIVTGPAPVWNDDTQSWHIHWHIPAGLRGATVVITVAPNNGAQPTSQSLVVT